MVDHWVYLEVLLLDVDGHGDLMLDREVLHVLLLDLLKLKILLYVGVTVTNYPGAQITYYNGAYRPQLFFSNELSKFPDDWNSIHKSNVDGPSNVPIYGGRDAWLFLRRCLTGGSFANSYLCGSRLLDPSIGSSYDYTSFTTRGCSQKK